MKSHQVSTFDLVLILESFIFFRYRSEDNQKSNGDNDDAVELNELTRKLLLNLLLIDHPQAQKIRRHDDYPFLRPDGPDLVSCTYNGLSHK